jgi:major histocompatibility complex class I
MQAKDSQIKYNKWPGVVVHAFNPSIREAEAGGFLSSRPAWSTK